MDSVQTDMQAAFEQITPNFGSSFFFKAFGSDDKCDDGYWHLHPEHELVYIRKGSGKRQVGQHLSQYEDGELVFLGPNLPHNAFDSFRTPGNLEIIIQLREDFLGNDFIQSPEMREVRKLFDRARQGVRFYGETKVRVGQKLEAMQNMGAFARLLSLLDIFQDLAITEEADSLEAAHPSIEIQGQDYDRMNLVHDYIQAHFTRKITLEEIAEVAHLTVPAFCRFFKKITHRTFTNFLNEYRISQACQMLAENRHSIAQVAFACGFNSVPYFNQRFKEHTGQSPKTYRAATARVVGAR
ncbi:MAG: AraC family transcriptional regulator [Bacteroidota bacterium]